MSETAAVVLGAGWSVAAGLPLTRDLFDGHVVAGSQESVNRMSTVLVEYATWTARNPGISAELFLLAAHGSTGGVGVPWGWVAEYLQARLAAPAAADSRGRSSLRYGQRITTITYCPAHTNFWLDTLAEYELNGVVTLNYDILAERSLRHRPMKRPPLPGFFYGGILPQAARGTALPFTVRDAQREVTPSGTVPLFKVHGSLNWSIGKPGGGRPAFSGSVVVYQDVRAAFRSQGTAAIVPPLPEKDPPLWALGIWEGASEKLREAEVWIVVGYSLPDYDVAMRDLLRSAALAGHVRRIVLHDPLAADLGPHWQAVTQVTEVMCLSPVGAC